MSSNSACKKKLFKQITIGFKEIEEAGVAHRNITDSNIIVCPVDVVVDGVELKVKAIDYGCWALIGKDPYSPRMVAEKFQRQSGFW